MSDKDEGREVKPPIVPTTCRCSTYNDNYRMDANGNKWCTLCGNYKGNIND